MHFPTTQLCHTMTPCDATAQSHRVNAAPRRTAPPCHTAQKCKKIHDAQRKMYTVRGMCDTGHSSAAPRRTASQRAVIYNRRGGPCPNLRGRLWLCPRTEHRKPLWTLPPSLACRPRQRAKLLRSKKNHRAQLSNACMSNLTGNLAQPEV